MKLIRVISKEKQNQIDKDIKINNKSEIYSHVPKYKLDDFMLIILI